jgi:hypothetical protein
MGLVMGYAGADEDEMHRGIAMLQRAHECATTIKGGQRG